MKQISIALNVVLIATLLFAFTTRHQLLLKTKIQEASSSYNSCTNCDGIFQGIPAQEFVQDIARYKKTHWDVVNKDAKTRGVPTNTTSISSGQDNRQEARISIFQDSRCIWFPLDTIKKFICNIENYSAQLENPIPSKLLGIRIYYAVYDKSDNKNRHSQHTLFMVPTTQNSDNEAEDFDPFLSASRRQTIYLPPFLSSAFSGKSGYSIHQALMALGAGTYNNYMQNNGNLCPTNCPKANTLDAIDNRYGTGIDY